MSEFVMSLPPAADEACAVHFCWEQDYQNLCSEEEAEVRSPDGPKRTVLLHFVSLSTL